MDKWIHEKLSECLKFPVPEDLVQYIQGIDNLKELEDNLKNLLNVENPHHREFLTEILLKKKKEKSSNKKKKSKASSVGVDDSVKENVDKEETTGKKKAKFVNLYSQEGQDKEVVLLSGRHHCDCQASKHKLINNCLQCGRIVCKQEGSGPCLFCGNIVCTPEEQKIIESQTKKAGTLLNKLKEQKRPQGWEAALVQRNKLLEFDKTSERRTKVMDDDSDYFSSGSVWLSKAERDKLQKYEQSLRDKRHASRRNQTFTFDFAGRTITEEHNTYDGNEVEEEVRRLTQDAQKIALFSDQKNGGSDQFDGDIHPGYIGPTIEFDDSVKSQIGSGPPKGLSQHIPRVQDACLQEMTDRGACLSMHQPWASLLVAGIKKDEGRSWYTSHRGRLWIASTVQPPGDDLIRSIEHACTVFSKNENIQFPKSYPTGCLLGCVNVENCLPQEEYREKYPDGESESPFVFICTDPIELRLRFPVSGKHKIYTLDSNIHQAALKSMQKFAKIDSKNSMNV